MRYGSIKRWAPLVSGDAATVRPPSRVRAWLFSLKRGKGICSHDHKGEEEEEEERFCRPVSDHAAVA